MTLSQANIDTLIDALKIQRRNLTDNIIAKDKEIVELKAELRGVCQDDDCIYARELASLQKVAEEMARALEIEMWLLRR